MNKQTIDRGAIQRNVVVWLGLIILAIVALFVWKQRVETFEPATLGDAARENILREISKERVTDLSEADRQKVLELIQK